MTDDEISEYIQEGYRSFRRNFGEYINPHYRGSDRYNLFERGWIQAQKQTPDYVIREWANTKIASGRFDKAEKERKKQLDISKYKKRKGS
tara:strand:+ start:2587 stop:2856 length:270 start_codon:yes stop_codon:yes gene_type:complete